MDRQSVTADLTGIRDRVLPLGGPGGPYLLAVLFRLSSSVVALAGDVLRATPYLAFFPACVFASILGGFGPGLLAFVPSLALGGRSVVRRARKTAAHS